MHNHLIIYVKRYRNASQHRRGVAFQWLRRLCRTLSRVDALDIPHVTADLADSLPPSPPSGTVRVMRLPSYSVFSEVLRRLLRAAVLLRAAQGMCERAFSAACSDLAVALFMPLNLVCAATAARLRVALAGQLEVVTRSYKTIALCTTWSSAPGNRSGVRAAARGDSEARSVAKETVRPLRQFTFAIFVVDMCLCLVNTPPPHTHTHTHCMTTRKYTTSSCTLSYLIVLGVLALRRCLICHYSRSLTHTLLTRARRTAKKLPKNESRGGGGGSFNVEQAAGDKKKGGCC